MATATGVIVDIARMPVYLVSEVQALLSAKVDIILALVGCPVGTFWGVRKDSREAIQASAVTSHLCFGCYMPLKGAIL